MADLGKSVIGPMLVMSSSIIASIPYGYVANYFTYHFLLASYFGGHYVAPRNLTLLLSLQENFTLPFNLPASLA